MWRPVMTSSRSLLRLAILLSLAAPLAACAASTAADDPPGGGGVPANLDDAPPLGSADEITMGAPSNDDLPSEGKADQILPPKFDIVALQSPVRNQARRGVCSIFSTVGLMEHLYIKEGTVAMPDFSEQFLQWSVKNEVGDFRNTEGSNASSNLESIHRFGIVSERDWPYETEKWTEANDPMCGGEESARPTRCFTNGEPPATALSARRWHLPAGRWINSRAESIKGHIFATNTAVIVGGTFFYQAWNHRLSTLPTSQEYFANGWVLAPNDEDRAASLMKRAGHSFLIVGWDDNLEVQRRDAQGNPMVDAMGQPVMEKGFFLFKNSWGTGSFGVNNPFGPGYGWISYRYVAQLSASVADVPVLMQDTEVCNDGADNDGDMAEDCADSDCTDHASCTSPMSTTHTSTTVVPIPDNDPAGATSEIVVAEGGEITALSVTVDVTHSYRGDLRIVLSKGERQVVLLDRDGGGADDVHQTFAVDDFDGQDAAGTWKLTVVDTARVDEGQLTGWSLTISR